MSEKYIQVSGNERFSGNQWKEAIRHYLLGMASGDNSVTYRPKIRIEDYLGGHECVLRFGLMNTKNPVYWAEGAAWDDGSAPDFCEQDVLIVGCQQPEAEWGMTRFVHDDKVKCLRIRLGSFRNLVFWKKPDGELGIAIDYRDENL